MRKGIRPRNPRWKSEGEAESNGDDKIWKERVSIPLQKEKRNTKDATDEYGKLTSLHSRFIIVILHHSSF